MEPNKYTVTLHIRREGDGKEAVLTFDDNRIAPISSTEGVDFGRFRLVAEDVPDPNAITTKDFGGCLKYCTIDEGNSLAYCLGICAAGS